MYAFESMSINFFHDEKKAPQYAVQHTKKVIYHCRFINSIKFNQIKPFRYNDQCKNIAQGYNYF